MTQGRTGTHYLTALLADNINGAIVHHEILGWDKFGVDTPDVSHMTLFNSAGNIPKVKAFWEQKLKRIIDTQTQWYAETSHLLIKAGLVENLEPLLMHGEVHFICVKRDITKTILSYLKDAHFANRGMWWMWYLDPGYPKNILPFKSFQNSGIKGVCLWYIFEIQARIEYYKMLLADTENVFFHDIMLDDLNEPENVHNLLMKMGLENDAENVIIPPPKGVSGSKNPFPPGFEQSLQNFVKRFTFNPFKAAEKFYNSGRRL
jgi:hypothetical protein